MSPKIIYHKCDKCGYEENNSCPITTWKCPKCGFSKRKIYHKCNICGYEEYTMSPNWTCKCQKTFICDKCNKEFIYEGDINYFKKKKFYICEACQNKLLGKGKGIYKCNNCGEFIKATNNYNICPHCNKIINKCENGLKIKFCNVCKKETRHNGNICLVCNPSSSTNKYEFLLNNVNEWNKFKCNFENNVKHVFLDDFTYIPTFREQNSTSWGDNGKLFEQYLVDKNIGWFIYIKFYINNNNEILSLIIGKTGSLLVNKGGTDIRFTYNIKDGLARKFLKDNCYDWCKTQIAILKCKTEQEALEKEKYFEYKYNLFHS